MVYYFPNFTGKYITNTLIEQLKKGWIFHSLFYCFFKNLTDTYPLQQRNLITFNPLLPSPVPYFKKDKI